GWICGRRLPSVADERERLNGLPQAHVIGEDPAQAMAPEHLQPPESLDLIRPQGCPQRRWYGHRFANSGRSILVARKRSYGGDPPLSLSDHDAEFDQLIPEPSL